MTKEAFFARLRAVGQERLIAGFQPLLRPAVDIAIEPTGRDTISPDADYVAGRTRSIYAIAEDDLPLGVSKIGGLPDLPPGMEWPTFRELQGAERRAFVGEYAEIQVLGGPLFFLAQINLAEVAPFDTERALPEEGMLYFFAALQRDGYPDAGVTPDCWRVLYHPAPVESGAALTRTPFPGFPEALAYRIRMESSLPRNGVIRPCAVTVTPTVTLPGSEWEETNAWPLAATEELSPALESVLWEVTYGRENSPNFHLLGYPQEVQGDMRCDCAAEAVYRETGKYPAGSALESAEVESWRLLFQVDTVPEIGLLWPAWGRGYFWIRREDLAARRFDRVCVVNQHT